MSCVFDVVLCLCDYLCFGVGVHCLFLFLLFCLGVVRLVWASLGEFGGLVDLLDKFVFFHFVS